MLSGGFVTKEAKVDAPRNISEPQTSPTLAMLNSVNITLIEGQDNHPLFTESVSPSSGVAWTWSSSGLSGFNGGPNLWFEYPDDGVGEPNELHTYAEFHWSNFIPTDWENGADGSFTLTLSNGIDADRNYLMHLSIRKLLSNGYTVFNGQSTGGNMASTAGAEGFVFEASGFSGFAPSPTLTFNEMGAIASITHFGSWNQDGSFTLTIRDGGRIDSIFSNMNLSLRSLMSDGYTVFEQQDSGGQMVNLAAAESYSFEASSFSGFAPSPTLTFDSMGAVTSCTHVGSWNQDGTFDLTIKDGTRPDSVFAGLNLSLRTLLSDGYTVFEKQTAGGEQVNMPGVHGFAFDASGFSGFAPSPTLTLNSMGAVTSLTHVGSWDQDGSFTLSITDGSRPNSVITSMNLSLRSLSSVNFILVRFQSSDINEVNGDPTGGSYKWSAIASEDFRRVGGVLPLFNFSYDGGDTRYARIEAFGVHDDDWTEEVNGSITLFVKDGARPDAIFNAYLSLMPESATTTTSTSSTTTTDIVTTPPPAIPMELIIATIGVVVVLMVVLIILRVRK
jgi:hypothetical protein